MEAKTQKKPGKEEVVKEAFDVFYKRHPGFLKKYGKKGKERSYKDRIYYLSHFESAISANGPKLFTYYLAWCKMFFKNIKFPLKYVVECLIVLRDIFESISVSGKLHEISVRMIRDFFEMEGLDTYYLEANIPGKSIISMS